MNKYNAEDYINSKSVSSIKLNIGGRIFEVKWAFLRRFPNSRLQRLYLAVTHEELNEICDEYNLRINEYYFDRHPKYFEMIWNLLKTGQFYFESEYCALTFVDELKYWGYSLKNMPFCCTYEFDKTKESIDEELHKVKTIMKQLELAEESERENKISQFQIKLWNVMEHPETSLLARTIAILSIVFIVLSTGCLIVSSLPEFHESNRTRKRINISNITTPSLSLSSNSTTIKLKYEEIFDSIEYACIGWFTLEYLLRFTAASKRLKFMVEFLNIIDLIAIAPFYVTLTITLIYRQGGDGIESLESISKVVQVFRVLRVVRVIKLARHSVGLQSLGYTLRQSYKELGMLVGFIIFGVYLFSCLVYFSEYDDNPIMFPSIPGSFWWAIISMTTVGYGDVYPITPFGQLFASICCVSGVLVVALPIPIIVSNFSEFYKDKLRMEKAKRRKEELDQNSHQMSTFIMMNSFAQSTLAFFHAFGRSADSETRQSAGDNTLTNPISRNNSSIISNELWQYHRGNNNTMDLVFETHHWKYIDTSSSGSFCSDDENGNINCQHETDEEEI